MSIHTQHDIEHNIGIWGYAFGYFASYVPYSMLTKAVSSGLWNPNLGPVDGLKLLPPTALASFVGMVGFIWAMGWLRHASKLQIGSLAIPFPTMWTFLSGLCTSGIIATTTLAYTFTGSSIVFMMLLMRGGVLVIAPVVDALTGRHVRWNSWIALLLSLAALLVAFSDGINTTMSAIAAVDVTLYLLFYFVRLRLMSRLAKNTSPGANVRYFVEEQLVAAPALVLLLCLVALFGQGAMPETIRAGFSDMLTGDYLAIALIIGLCSQGTGIFGGLILLDARENSFCVPVNRASSILAGLVASYGLVWLYNSRQPSGHEWAGAAFILLAIGFLSYSTIKKALGK
ncbi:MAG: hypothetical protein HUU55_07825 [Myxococcales bacterium]|nr:hypothetical protein [Myxococcales bacterium]